MLVLNPPEIVVNEDEKVSQVNSQAKLLLGDQKVNDLGDIFQGVVSLKLFNKKEMKFPLKTTRGERMAEVTIEDVEDNKKKITIPLEKNEWVDNLLREIRFEESEVVEKKDALAQINETEEELKESTDFDGGKRTLILNFESADEFNSFSKEIKDRENIKIEETDRSDNQILAVVKVTSPTRKWL